MDTDEYWERYLKNLKYCQSYYQGYYYQGVELPNTGHSEVSVDWDNLTNVDKRFLRSLRIAPK